jgi:hypothetical protein
VACSDAEWAAWARNAGAQWTAEDLAASRARQPGMRARRDAEWEQAWKTGPEAVAKRILRGRHRLDAASVTLIGGTLVGMGGLDLDGLVALLRKEFHWPESAATEEAA